MRVTLHSAEASARRSSIVYRPTDVATSTAAGTLPGTQTQTAEELAHEWATDPRWAGIRRDYTAEDVIALRGSVREDPTLARRGAQRLWDLLHTRTHVPALGALTGNQAVQQVRAGLEDNVRLDRDRLAPSNAALIARAADLCAKYGRPVATPAEARRILGLKAA